MSLPTDPETRKGLPLTTGVLDYFPRAIAAVAHCSKVGNDQHNPGEPLHWAKEKSTDHADCITRHLVERGTIDTDGVRHSAKVAWRALALLEIELEKAEADADAAALYNVEYRGRGETIRDRVADTARRLAH
jgi:hypothetical protein